MNDAFSAAHRAHASTEGVAHLLPAYAGRAMQEELEALERRSATRSDPVLAIVGGAKISTKLELLSATSSARSTRWSIGGGMANTFLAAKGVEIGKSLNEPDLAATARQIMQQAADAGCAIVLPADVVVASRIQGECAARDRGARPRAGRRDDPRRRREDRRGDQRLDRPGEDAGLERPARRLRDGALRPRDRRGGAARGERTREGKLLSVAGGGDTVAALNHAGVADDFSYVSTAGGAFLEWLEGKPLPGVEALRGRS